ncbi:MAG TPA: endonuclease III domain-containing protein [Candidatus Sulfotelmatobacter sp.]|nr:endonuclease III domain-containing protein [Candidatus Sulfotelmatobacter sp.]
MCATGILPNGARLRRRSSQPLRRSKTAVEGRALPELGLYYDALYRAYGPQHWWPGRTRFEVIVGAILTQSTSWSNVERAITALRREKLLSASALERVSTTRLARLIRSSGYFNQKARKLKAFVQFLRKEYGGSLDKLFAVPTRELREQLLGVRGIGPETADSILLYAGKHAVFVVDAYTRRILERHQLADGKQSYDEIRELFERSLPASVAMFNEYHALIVHTGKHFCRKSAARCEDCALRPFLPRSEEVRG